MNLSTEMARLPEPPNDSRPPYWDYWRHQLWELAQRDDPHNFTKWPPIYHCMLVEHWWPDVMRTEYDYVYDRLPMPLPVNTPDDRNMIHQLYHLLRWEEVTGKHINQQLSIYEFGGGYGAMALACHRLGFRGKYYIYDLPEFALLQQWHLEKCGIGNVEWVSKDEYNYVDLLIACYSLSETDFDERDYILRAWSDANSYLFLYSNKFEQYDNIEYFRGLEYGEWMVSNWRHEHIEHLPPESWYTWGW